jgi:hypothetical protein
MINARSTARIDRTSARAARRPELAFDRQPE